MQLIGKIYSVMVSEKEMQGLMLDRSLERSRMVIDVEYSGKEELIITLEPHVEVDKFMGALKRVLRLYGE